MGKLDDNGSPHADIDFSDLAPGRSLSDEGLRHEETFIEAYDGEQLFCQWWERREPPPSRGAVALMHGYGEHSSRYDHVAGALARSGYAVMAIDARGHGRSTGKRAHVESYADYVRDYESLVRRLKQTWPQLPTFCLGHSNGGLIVLQYALASPAGIEGFVVTSPMCGFALEVSPLKSGVGKLLSRLWPSFSLSSDLNPEHLTRVSEVVEAYERDPLVQQRTTARWFTEAMSAQKELRRRASELDQPFLFVIPGDDRICDPEAAEDVFHHMTGSNREMQVLPDAYHEVLNERNWREVVGQVVDWMDG